MGRRGDLKTKENAVQKKNSKKYNKRLGWLDRGLSSGTYWTGVDQELNVLGHRRPPESLLDKGYDVTWMQSELGIMTPLEYLGLNRLRDKQPVVRGIYGTGV